MSYPTPKQDLIAANAALAEQRAKIAAYVASPALDADGGPRPLPLKRRIALATATKRVTVAQAAYDARYGAKVSA